MTRTETIMLRLGEQLLLQLFEPLELLRRDLLCLPSDDFGNKLLKRDVSLGGLLCGRVVNRIRQTERECLHAVIVPATLRSVNPPTPTRE